MSRMNAGNPRNYDFSKVPQVECPRTRMFRPGSVKTTMNCNFLYPLYLDEVLPGDTHRLEVATFARMTTAICPFMDNLYLDWQFFFVPNRLVWDHWQEFCGERHSPNDTTEYTVPYVTCPDSGFSRMGLFDHMGIPPAIHYEDGEINALPFRAYNLIWNEWYKDQNVQSDMTVNTGDGPDSPTLYGIRYRGKRKDYFTSCLPAPQNGPAVSIPLTEPSIIPVRGNGLATGFTTTNPASTSNIFGLFQTANELTLKATAYGSTVGTSNTSGAASLSKTVGVTTDASKSGLEAVFDNPASVSINALRQAFQLQKFAERLARGGTRYIEILRSMFGVVSPDARLQRPELLTSFTIPLNLYQNQQTSASESGSTPQGNITANGTFTGLNFAFNRSFVEHGYIIGLASIRSDQTYQQGIHRMFSRRTKYDFYWPTFAHLGEQAVLNKEIFAQGTSADNDVFGYQERWSEYKYGQNRISGVLRSSHPQSLDCYHLAQDFSTLPTLNNTFIHEGVPINRVLAVSSSDTAPAFIVDASFRLISARPLPLYDIPGLVDHF